MEIDPGTAREESTAQPEDRSSRVSVSIIIPLLDDRDGIGPCLESVQRQIGDRSVIQQILVADGGSTDGSREWITRARDRDARIELLENPDRFAPHALNRAIAAATSDVIVRVDSHTVLEDDYVDTCVQVLEESGSDVVGGPMRPRGTSAFGRAVAWALCSRWGIGGSRFHDDSYHGLADSVYMGAFPARTFTRFGGYDERFVRNQDDELTYRIRARGGTVYLSNEIRSVYTPRDTAKRLAKQFYGYGRFKPLVLTTHPSGIRPRHLIPPATAAAWMIVPLAIVARRRSWATPALAHAIAIGLAASPGKTGWRDRAIALLAMHLGYGSGFLVGAVGLARRPG